MAKKQKIRLGRVSVHISYVVDLDDKDMVQEAKDCLREDICNAVKHNEENTLIKITPDPKAKVNEIAEFLVENHIDRQMDN